MVNINCQVFVCSCSHVFIFTLLLCFFFLGLELPKINVLYSLVFYSHTVVTNSSHLSIKTCQILGSFFFCTIYTHLSVGTINCQVLSSICLFLLFKTFFCSTNYVLSCICCHTFETKSTQLSIETCQIFGSHAPYA